MNLPNDASLPVDWVRMSQPLLIGILLVVVIAAAAGGLLVYQGTQAQGGPGTGGGTVEAPKGVHSEVRDPAAWDLSLVPTPAGEALKTWTTPAGTLVKRLTKGKREVAAPGRPIVVRTRMWLLTGHALRPEVHEQVRIDRLEARFPKGIAEGLADLRLRERRQLLVPSELAYGERGRGGIPPHADLVIEAEWVRLEIIELQEGTGAVARRGRSKVLVAYRGTLEDGTVFDSRTNADPIEFPLRDGSLIKGWVLGMDGMRVGGVRKLWVPWHLAYGERGQGKDIGPFSDLEFTVELMGVKGL